MSVTLAMACLAACALPVKQVPTAAPLVPATGQHFVLNSDAECSLRTGYSRTLRQGTRWNLFGKLQEGDVYRSPDQVVTAEGFDVHEAYLIVKDSGLVGFYLPVERTLTPVAKQVQLQLTKTE